MSLEPDNSLIQCNVGSESLYPYNFSTAPGRLDVKYAQLPATEWKRNLPPSIQLNNAYACSLSSKGLDKSSLRNIVTTKRRALISLSSKGSDKSLACFDTLCRVASTQTRLQNELVRNRHENTQLHTKTHKHSARLAYLSWRIEIGRDWYRSRNGRDLGAKVKMCTPVHGLSGFSAIDQT